MAKVLRKQLKKEYPNWKKLKKNEKKAIVKKVLSEVVKDYDYDRPVRTPFPELLGIENQVGIENEIMNQEDMEKLISDFNNGGLVSFV